MSMRVLVTGGTGRVGRATVERLVACGHDVLVIGRTAGRVITGARYAACDVTDSEALAAVARGADAVVHLAAYASPSRAAAPEVFRVNALGTFCVYDAAAAAGIGRVVCASSINALGYNYGVREFAIRYFPIDEEHPTSGTDSYSFSKGIGEAIADYFARRDGIASVCLRFPWVAPAEVSEEQQVGETFREHRSALEELAALPAAERGRRIGEWLRMFAHRRDSRQSERGDPLPPWGCLMDGYSDFWTALDERDAALAIERGLEADFAGSHVLYICDSHNRTGIPSETLAGLFFPEVSGRRRPLVGTESLVSIDRARALIGFEPEHSIGRWLAEVAGRDSVHGSERTAK